MCDMGMCSEEWELTRLLKRELLCTALTQVPLELAELLHWNLSSAKLMHRWKRGAAAKQLKVFVAFTYGFMIIVGTCNISSQMFQEVYTILYSMSGDCLQNLLCML